MLTCHSNFYCIMLMSAVDNYSGVVVKLFHWIECHVIIAWIIGLNAFRPRALKLSRSFLAIGLRMLVRQHAKFEPDRTNITGVMTKIVGTLEEWIFTPIFGQVQKITTFEPKKNSTCVFHLCIEEGKVYSEKNKLGLKMALTSCFQSLIRGVN